MQDFEISTQDSQAQPLVSFIITSYNLPVELLKACVESIVALGLADNEREIILVDDGSDVSPVSDLPEQIIYLRQAHQGLSTARNSGLRMATGRYIQFLDGDDLLLKTAYDACLDLLKDSPDVVFFHLVDRIPSDNSTSTVTAEAPVSGVSYMHNNNLRGSACGYLFRRAILTSLKFTPNMLHEDEEFTPMLMLRAEKVVETDAQAYYYRTRETSITHEEDEAHIEKRLADTEQILYKLQEQAATLPEMDRVALNRRIAQLTMDYLYQVAKLTHSSSKLEEAVERLRAKSLFPLPNKSYTHKYSLFRKLVSTQVGRKILVKSV
ncbi:MAG: glycosyltransferase [Prevotella sp.]|nr:glycosyltransferase [Prevotella sp.]